MNLDGLKYNWGQILYRTNSEEPLQLTGVLYRPDNCMLLEVEDQSGCCRYVHESQVTSEKPFGMGIFGQLDEG